MLGLHTLQQYNAAYGHVFGYSQADKNRPVYRRHSSYLYRPLSVFFSFFLSRDKRELHGSARFASIREIKKLGLMKKNFYR